MHREGLGEGGVQELRQLSVEQEIYREAVQPHQGGELAPRRLAAGPAAVVAPGLAHVGAYYVGTDGTVASNSLHTDDVLEKAP